MIITALTLALIVVLSLMALGSAITAMLFSCALAREALKWRRTKVCDSWAIILFALMILLSAALSTGLVFAALAIGRNLL